MNIESCQLKNNQPVLDLFKQFREINSSGRILFSRNPSEPELLPHTLIPFRLVLMLKGKYRIQRYEKTLVDEVLFPGDILLTLRHGLLINRRLDEDKFTLLTVVYWNTHTRFLITENSGVKGLINHWFHTSRTIQNAGKYLLESIYELSFKEDEFRESLEFLLKTLIDLSEWEIENDEGTFGGKAYDTYLMIKNHIMAEAKENITREHIAKMMGISPSHISKLFKRFDNDNFNTALQRQKVEYGAFMLKNYPNHNINEIAWHCGFKSAALFSRTFRKFYKITPGAYRSSTT